MSSSCVCEPTLTSSSRTPAKEKTFVGEINNLAGVPDNRCNSGARTRMACVIVPSWPLPRTSYQVNITVNKQITVSKQWLSLPSSGKCCYSSTGTTVPCRSCGPAVGDGTTRGGLVGHFCDACTYVTLRPVASSVPLSLPPRRESRYLARFVQSKGETVCYTFDTVTALTWPISVPISVRCFQAFGKQRQALRARIPS